MNICGIIAEYNPFHTGHLYHLKQARTLSNADYTIVIMSGNFVQRGAPALTDKFNRAKMALSCGADMVIELPSYYALGSAEYFATGAISLLHKLGAVTHLCFGSECGDIQILSDIATSLQQESPTFQAFLKDAIKSGFTYPQAYTKAAKETYPHLAQYMEDMASPNNLLGLEYIKALQKQKSSIIPLTIKRMGSGYHEDTLEETYSSATAIRKAFSLGCDPNEMSTQLPVQVQQILKEHYLNNTFVFTDDFSLPLHYKLLSEQDKGFSQYLDVSSDLSDRIVKYINDFTSISQFSDLLKTKEITYTRISRCLFHILLNIKKDDALLYMNANTRTPYARVLGFRKDSKELFTVLDKNTSIPLITKLADADKILDSNSYQLLEKEIQIHSLYHTVTNDKTKSGIRNECSTPIVMI